MSNFTGTKNRPLVWGTVISLVFIGTLGMITRRIAFNKAYPARGDNIWRVRFHISLEPVKTGTSLKIFLPSDTVHSKKLKQTFSHPGFSMYMVKKKETSDQQIIAIARHKEDILHFIADFDIHVFPSKKPATIRTILPSDGHLHYLRHEEEIQVKNQNIRELASRLSRGLKDKREIIDNIYSYCSEQIADGGLTGAHDALGTLASNKGSLLGRVRLLAALCRANRIPARVVTGFILDEDQEAAPHYWLEIYRKTRWIPYDPANEFAGEIPANYLPVRRDSIHIVHTDNKSKAYLHCTIKRNKQIKHLSFLRDLGWLAIFDYTRLPLNMQKILALLLLLPVGALITTLFRNIIGLQTIGTFTPALLALSFVYADWHFGIALFILIFIIGLAGRCFLDYLKLLMVPRLGVILSLIVLCLTLSVSLLDFLKLTPSAQAVILPIVILTMMIERFYIHSEEDSLLKALQLLGGTLLVSSICFFLLQWEYLGIMAVQFPEAQFVIAALLILLGRYSGYRISELWRFREFKNFSPPGFDQ